MHGHHRVTLLGHVLSLETAEDMIEQDPIVACVTTHGHSCYSKYCM